MPTDKKRISVTVEDWMYDLLEDYRRNNQLVSMSSAIVRIVTGYFLCRGEQIPGMDYKQVEEAYKKHITGGAESNGEA